MNEITYTPADLLERVKRIRLYAHDAITNGQFFGGGPELGNLMAIRDEADAIIEELKP